MDRAEVAASKVQCKAALRVGRSAQFSKVFLVENLWDLQAEWDWEREVGRRIERERRERTAAIDDLGKDEERRPPIVMIRVGLI